MKGDKKIIGLIKKLDSKIKEWLSLTTKDAWSDRLLEEIISLSKLIEETHTSRFNENAAGSLNAKDKFIKHWAIEDKKYGQPLSADDFNVFVKIGKEEGFKLNEDDFEKYFEFSS